AAGSSAWCSRRRSAATAAREASPFLCVLQGLLLEFFRVVAPGLLFLVTGLPHREVTGLGTGRDRRVEANVEAPLLSALLRRVDHALHEVALHAAVERLVVVLRRAP